MSAGLTTNPSDSSYHTRKERKNQVEKSKRKKRRGTCTSAKHPDGKFVTVSKRKDGRWSGYYYELDRGGNLDRSKRHNLCDPDRDRLIERIIERETPKTLTFGEVADQWWGEKWETIANSTAGSYRPCLRRLLEQFGDCGLEDIETADVNAFLNAIAAQGYSRRTVQMHKDIANMIFEVAIRNGALRYSPTDHATIPKNLPKKERELPPKEALVAVHNGGKLPFGLFAFLCFYSGMRRGEALALRYEDIDRKKRVIHITKSLEWVGNHPHVKEPKTRNSVRDVRVPDVLLDAIPLGIGPIFCRDDHPGELLRQSDFRRKWRQFCVAADIDITPHQLRHGYATMLYEAGIGPKEAQKLLGHANIKTTLNIYTHISEEMEDHATEKLNNFIAERFGNTDGIFDGESVKNA